MTTIKWFMVAMLLGLMLSVSVWIPMQVKKSTQTQAQSEASPGPDGLCCVMGADCCTGSN
jgi:hypothetical protein